MATKEQQSAGVELLPESIATVRQVNTLLMIVNTLRPFASAEDDQGHWDDDTSPAIDGGVACAAHTTLIKAMDRLDSIIGDSARWGLQEASLAQAVRAGLLNQVSPVATGTAPSTPPRPSISEGREPSLL